MSAQARVRSAVDPGTGGRPGKGGDRGLERPAGRGPTRLADRGPTRLADQGPEQPADQGTVMVLMLGFAVVLIGLVVVVVDVSVVLLNQRGVASAADGAAVAAAQEISESEFYDRGLQEAVPLDEGAVRQAVAAYAADVEPATRLSGSVTGGQTVVVVGERVVPLPFGRFVGRRNVTIRSIARATSPVLG